MLNWSELAELKAEIFARRTMEDQAREGLCYLLNDYHYDLT